MSKFLELITELRSAAATLRTPTGDLLPAQDRAAAELIERAADAIAMLERAPVSASPPPPGWEKAPAGFNFRAMDSDGHWSWFKQRPYQESFGHFDGWDADEGVRPARGVELHPNWRDSLEERPTITISGAPLPPEQAAPALQAVHSEAATSSVLSAWFTPAEKVPEESGTRVLAHVVMPAGHPYAVDHGAPEGWQAFDVATFWRRPDGAPDWEKETAGEILRWKYIDAAEVDSREEPWR